MTWSFKTILLVLINSISLLLSVAILFDIHHLRNHSLPCSDYPVSLSASDADWYQHVIQKTTTKRVYELFRMIAATLAVNIIIWVDLIAALWERVKARTRAESMRSAVFHTFWSIFTLTLYEYVDVRLFSTWLVRVADTGLSVLDPSMNRGKWWSLIVLSVGAIVWFISGYLVTSLRPRWQPTVFPILTLLLLIQVAYDLRVEPDFIHSTSEPLPLGPIFDEISKVAKICNVSMENIRFRKGIVGAGQTFGIYQNIIVLSGPDLLFLTPTEWSVLAVREFAHWHYRDTITRIVLRLSLRFFWAPIALTLMSLPTFFPAFSLPSESPLVIAFAVTEIFAVQFDWIGLLFVGWMERLMEYRADRYAVKVITPDLYMKGILKVAWINGVPFSSSRIYRYLVSGNNTPYSRIKHFLE